MGLAVTVACGSVHFARWCFLGVSSVVLVAQMARMTRRGRVRGRSTVAFRGRECHLSHKPRSQAHLQGSVEESQSVTYTVPSCVLQ